MPWFETMRTETSRHMLGHLHHTCHAIACLPTQHHEMRERQVGRETHNKGSCFFSFLLSPSFFFLVGFHDSSARRCCRCYMREKNTCAIVGERHTATTDLTREGDRRRRCARERSLAFFFLHISPTRRGGSSSRAGGGGASARFSY